MLTDERNFGLIIAFIIPGWVALLGLSPYVPLFAYWLEGPLEASPSVGGFLSALLAAIAIGVFLSTIRWLLVDPVVTFLSAPSPRPDFRHLRDAHDALRLLIEGHYRFYQFHGNTLIALLLVGTARWSKDGTTTLEAAIATAAICILLCGAIDTKKKYDRRMAELMLATEPLPLPSPAARFIKHVARAAKPSRPVPKDGKKDQ